MNRDSSDRSRVDPNLSALKRGFERILLKASLKLSNKEEADNSFFIGASLWVLERRLRHGSFPVQGKLTRFKSHKAEMAFNEGLVQDAICDLSEPIIEEVESGIPPSWAPSLVRLLSDDRLCPIQAPLNSPQSFPHTDFLVSDAENPIPLNLDYTSKWIDICCSLEKQNLFTDWTAKQKLVVTFSHLVMWHYDKIKQTQPQPQDGQSFEDFFHSAQSPLAEIPGVMKKLAQFLFDNRVFLEPSTNSMWLLAISSSSFREVGHSNWKGDPAALKKWDRIRLSDSEIVNVKEHFNNWNMSFTTESLKHPLGGTKKISENSLPAGIYTVAAVDPLTQSISLVSYIEFQKPEKPTESIPLEEIRAWVELEIRQEDGFITLEELANRWLSEWEISFNKALKPHGLKTSSLMELIVSEREDLYSVFDNAVTKSGLKVRVLKQGEDRETLEAIATASTIGDTIKRSHQWLANWPIPDEPGKIWDGLREVSDELRSMPTEKWEEHDSQSGKLDFRASARFHRLIFVQATNNDNWSRKNKGTPSDISPHGLLHNMIGAILFASKKDIGIDHKFISGLLDDLRESVLALSDATHNPIDSWNLIEGESHMQQVNLSEQARSLIKKQERRLAWKKREAKFGPVCNSPNLISDYLLAFSETPKSEDEFLAYAKKAYSERIKSSRTRYVGIGKSDKYVWKYQDIGAEKGLSPKESIILLLTDAGLSEERIARLLMASKQVKYPHAEEE